MFEGLNQAGASFAQAIERKKQNEQLDRKLSGILKLMYPEEDLTGLTLEDKQARFEAETLKGAKAIEQKKLQQMEAQIAQANAAAAASQAQVGIAQENQRYLNHQRDMAAEQQAGEAAYLKRYADVLNEDRTRARAPNADPMASSRYREMQQNPNLGMAARYMAQTGQVPSADVMGRYAMPQAAEQVQFVQAPTGQTIARLGKSMSVLPNQQGNTPREIQLIEALQKRGYSPAEAEEMALKFLGKQMSPLEMLAMRYMGFELPGNDSGTTPTKETTSTPTGKVPPPRQ